MISAAKYAYHVWRYGQSKAVLSLHSATVPNPADHAAVWLGVSDDNSDEWIQAGVEFTYGDLFPHVYVEANGPRAQGMQYHLRTKKVSWGQQVTVRLFLKNGRWYAGVDGMLNPGWSVPLPKRTQSQSLVETLGAATCAATIDGHLIKSGT